MNVWNNTLVLLLRYGYNFLKNKEEIIMVCLDAAYILDFIKWILGNN